MRLKRSAFGSQDAWVLAAVMSAEIAEPPAALDRVMAYGDALNHAVFTFDEMEGGLARLTAAGLVSEIAAEFRIAGSALAWRHDLTAKGLTAVDAVHYLAEKLGEESRRSDGWSYRLSRESYQRAIETNSARSQAILAAAERHDGA